MDQFHRNEAISAVADDAFLVEEDDDYEDLYNDVNIGEAGLRKQEQQKVSFERSKESVKPAESTPERQVLIPGVVGETSTSATDASNGYGAQGHTGGNGVSQQVPGGPVAGLRVELRQSTNREDDVDIPEQIVGNNEPLIKPGMGNGNGVTIPVRSTIGNGGGGTILFLGELHWWTTDAEIEAELCKYGTVKEVKFFDEKATGKSRGYCQVEFYESMAATACKEALDGHLFNGRPCVVAFASPYTVKKMGDAQVNRSQQAQAVLAQAKKGEPIDPPNKLPSANNITTTGNHQGGDGRGFGRGNWGRGNAQGMGGRGQVGQMRNRPVGMGGRGLMGNGGGGFGLPMMHPQAMMGQGFDPGFGGRMGSYGGFPGRPFPGVLSSFPHVGGVGLPGVAPHVNPAFFGRGVPMSGMGMMPNMGMWDPNAGGWGGEDLGGGRAAESSYGEEAASDHHDRGARSNPIKEKDRAAEREWSASSDRSNRDEKDGGYERDITRERDVSQIHDWPEKRRRDDRDTGRERGRENHKDGERSRNWNREREKERDRHKEERERHKNEPEHGNEWNRSRSSRAPSRSRMSREDNHRSRSKEADYGKRRRLTSE
ncbi:unnamed protein product [Thlaspi arvense]|uniref:RRM domain-containing protein n=1 Tax=Thlaspi arvense TaxID=13288 RepID=A0AAU9T624_THLAR|nr:unnamed protein product [Thlaspi arvense]